ncbi:hypothetical protein K474DRAFT_127177 [Panus rudis PR-1116 ss-1]|nr:hypothetical protein K474DRAFT_127177 [Panus rudis PR-1116 ss-1]
MQSSMHADDLDVSLSTLSLNNEERIDSGTDNVDSTRVSLPFEIITCIAEYFNGNTVKACALLNKSWNAACRPRIYYSVVLKDEEKQVELCQMLDRTPEIGYWVRNVAICGKPVTMKEPSHSHSKSSHHSKGTWNVDISLQILTRLHRLVSLELREAEILDSLPHTWFKAVQNSPAFTLVHTLRLTSKSTMTTNMITALATSMPRLRHLYFEGLFIMGSQSIAPDVAVSSLDLEAIPRPYNARRSGDGCWRRQVRKAFKRFTYFVVRTLMGYGNGSISCELISIRSVSTFKFHRLLTK